MQCAGSLAPQLRLRSEQEPHENTPGFCSLPKSKGTNHGKDSPGHEEQRFEFSLKRGISHLLTTPRPTLLALIKGLSSPRTGEPRLARRKQQSCFVFPLCARHISLQRQTQTRAKSLHKSTHFPYSLNALVSSLTQTIPKNQEPWAARKGPGQASCRQLGEHTESPKNCW